MPYKVAVLMGGSSFERDFSLASGKQVLRTLEAGGHTVLPLDTTGALVEILRREQPDVACIALHGGHGEDGTIQSLLEYLNIPFVGSPSGVCRTAWNKSMLPVVLKSQRRGVAGPTHWPRGVLFSATAFKDYGAAGALDLITEHLPMGYPYAVLPASGGSALGIRKVTCFEELAPALLEALSFDDEVLVEEWVTGVELAVSVIGSGEAARALPPIEVCPRGGFFNTEVRLDSNLVDYYAPVRPESLAADDAEATRIRTLIEEAALEVHRCYGCRDLSRVDMFWDGGAGGTAGEGAAGDGAAGCGKVKVLEVNTSPGMSEHSLLPMAAAAAKIPFAQLLDELLEMALARS